MNNTGDNAQALVDLINSPILRKLVICASINNLNHESFTSDFYDGAETNFPLLRAVAEMDIPGVGILFIVYDGNFLTAVRSPRDGEIKAVLTEAIKSDKVFFNDKRVNFTGKLSAEDAAKYLRSGHLRPLIKDTVNECWALFSCIPL